MTLTHDEKEIYHNYLIQLLEKPASNQILLLLTIDKRTTGHVYRDKEKNQFQLRIDTL